VTFEWRGLHFPSGNLSSFTSEFNQPFFEECLAPSFSFLLIKTYVSNMYVNCSLCHFFGFFLKFVYYFYWPCLASLCSPGEGKDPFLKPCVDVPRIALFLLCFRYSALICTQIFNFLRPIEPASYGPDALFR